MAQPVTDIIGNLEPPEGVANFNQGAGGPDVIGIFYFISTIIRLGMIVAGLFVLYNLFAAGFDYITAADGKGGAQAREKITSSVIGMVIIISAYTIIGLLGLIFFGNPTYFIDPKVCGPTGC